MKSLSNAARKSRIHRGTKLSFACFFFICKSRIHRGTPSFLLPAFSNLPREHLEREEKRERLEIEDLWYVSFIVLCIVMLIPRFNKVVQ